jgi:ABC transporter substrate binding protein
MIAAPVRDTSELESAIAAQARAPNGGLVVMTDSFLVAHREEITSLAARHRLPAVYPFRFFVELGGLLSYGNDLFDSFRRAATYADRILKGATPNELPVQATVQFELVINLKTAKALGLEVPPTLLARADEVIERSGRSSEAERFHRAARRRCGNVAPRGTRAAAYEARRRSAGSLWKPIEQAKRASRRSAAHCKG